jgi:hypothetical protein
MFNMPNINHTQSPAAPASNTQVVNEPINMNGSGAVAIPKLGFFVAVAVVNPLQKERPLSLLLSLQLSLQSLQP